MPQDDTRTPLQKQAIANLQDAIIGIDRAYGGEAILLEWVVLARWWESDGPGFTYTAPLETDVTIIEGLLARMNRELTVEALRDALEQ
jgi:hypothetical protein